MGISMTTWYSLCLSDRTPLLAWDPMLRIDLDDATMRLDLTVDGDSMEQIASELFIPELDPGEAALHRIFRVTLTAKPWVVMHCRPRLRESENPLREVLGSSFENDDSLSRLHDLGSFELAEWLELRTGVGDA
ncbi:MAG: hypothetical protein KC609_14050 [Myxococcales bacterium]|nr:hypothetical protein [Myxococcales bacterium]